MVRGTLTLLLGLVSCSSCPLHCPVLYTPAIPHLHPQHIILPAPWPPIPSPLVQPLVISSTISPPTIAQTLLLTFSKPLSPPSCPIYTITHLSPPSCPLRSFSSPFLLPLTQLLALSFPTATPLLTPHDPLPPALPTPCPPFMSTTPSSSTTCPPLALLTFRF